MKYLHLIVLSLLSTLLLASCNELEDIVKNEDNETTEKLKYYFEENFVDSLDAIYCSNEHIILFGFGEVPVSSELTREERIIYIGRVEDNAFVEEDAIVMVVDSTNYPVRIAAQDFNMILSKVDESHFDCAVYSSQTAHWVEYNNLSCELSNKKNRISSRTLVSGGYSEFGLDDIFSIANIINSLKQGLGSALNDDNLGVLESNLDILNEFNLNDEAVLGIGIALSGNLGSALLNLGGYLAKKLDDFVVEQLGKVRLSIDDIQYIDATTHKIEYSINGLNENGLKYSEIGLEVHNPEAMFYLDYIKSENCSGYRFVKLPPGKYVVELYIKSTKYELVEYRVMHTFNVFDLKVNKYEIEENPLYKDGTVNFKMNVFLNGNKENLKDVQQFGYYIKYANAIDYKEVKNLSSIFESTPLTYELSIPRDGFSGNYSTFEAKPSIDYYIGVYVVLKNGDIVHFDEEAIEGLVYDTKPSCKYLDSNITGTEITSTEVDKEGNQIIHYKTEFQNHISILGSFWIEYLEWQCEGNGWEKISGDNWYIENDGVYNTTHFSTYTNGVNLTHNVYYIIHFTNGSSRRCDNYLTVSGSETITNVSIVGSRLSKQKKFVVKRMPIYDVNATNTNSIRK